MSFGDPADGERGSLGPPPLPFRTTREPFRSFRRLRWLALIVLLFVLIVVAAIGKGIYADYLWFDSVGLASVYRTEIIAKVWLFFAGAAVFLAFIGINLWLARRLSPKGLEESFVAEVEPATLRRVVTIGAVAGSLFLAIIFGAVAAGQWDTVLRAINAVDFGTTDPAFHKDLGFYVFALPALRFFQGWLLGAAIVTLIGVVGVYAFVLSLQNFDLHLSRGLKGHVGGLICLVLLVFIFGYVLSVFGLTTSTHGVVEGATYTDVHARVPSYYIIIVFTVLAGAGVLWSVFGRGFAPAVGAGTVWVLSLIVVLLIYPAVVQRFTVDPNELAKETPYIQRNIEMTRAAYGLNAVDEQPFSADNLVSPATVQANQDTINNIRLWDPRFALLTYQQQQELRQLYVFGDVDVDRYQLNNAYTEVTLAARELALGNLPVNARGWVNVHLQYTHGYGVVMNPVNKVDALGLPDYNLRDIPPTGTPEVTEPRLYYGEQTDQYVIVGAKQAEFDYESGQGVSQETRYSGHSGVSIGSLLRRFVYAWEFSDFNMLISAQINGGSRLLYHRNIKDRISHIAPFLSLDKDPYLVVADGKLFWIQDAYTTTADYPYSEQSAGGFNYVRNSVKIVVDAYTGDVNFYLVDTSDPIARSYQRIFPNLLKPLDAMPASLRTHLRYPEDLFTAQADVFRTYHMTDPRVFYNKEDLWATPKEGTGGGGNDVQPYYVIMRLPNADKEEFVLIRPFTPANKPNAVAWIGARSDGANYGKLAVYRFPSSRLIPGPAQVQSSIDGQPEISRTFSLLNVQGSHIQRGNLLLIPIGQSYLYVEPVYLAGDQNPKPAVIAVIIYSNDKVFMEPTLAQTLAVSLGQQPPSYTVGAIATAPQTAAGNQQAPQVAAPSPTSASPAAGASRTPTATLASGNVQDLIRQAVDADTQAQAKLRSGDFAGYGEQESRLRALLDQLGQLTGQATVTPTPQR